MSEKELWLQTTCLECKKQFLLDYGSVCMESEDITHDYIPIIICPHCGKRYEY